MSIHISTPPTHNPQEHIDCATLKSKRAYTCVFHPTKEAFCVCAKCGALLCKHCYLDAGGRRYCESCLLQDNALRETLERELIRETRAKAMPPLTLEAPQTWKQIPGALLNMLKDSVIFFRSAYKTPFRLSFLPAFLALLPNAIVIYVLKIHDIVARLAQTPQIDPTLAQTMTDVVSQASSSTLILTAIIATILKILLFDFSLFICTRICTASKLTWAQISSTMHFCLLPLIITPFAAYFEVSFVGFLALALVIIQTSTAIRSATSCSIFQGFFTMLGFIVLTTLLNLFAV